MKWPFLLLLLSRLLMGIGSAQEGEPPGPLPPSTMGMRVCKGLPYVPHGHERQTLDIYIPENGERPLPLLVWIHGGAWKYGSKAPCPLLPWLRKGYVVASIDYRLSQDAEFPAQIRDCKAAIRWLRSHAKIYGIDPERVAVWGESAGGHLASLVGTAGDVDEWEQAPETGSSQVQAVIDWYGRADLTPVFKVPVSPDSPVALLLGGSDNDVAEMAQEASPISHVSKDDPPFLIMHGDMDEIVPLRQSQAFAWALRNSGVDVELLILKGVGHGGCEFMQPDQVKAIDTFLDEHLHHRKGALFKKKHE